MHTNESALNLLGKAAVKEMHCLELLKKAVVKSDTDIVAETMQRVAATELKSMLDILRECSGGEDVRHLSFLCGLHIIQDCESNDNASEPEEEAKRRTSVLPPDCLPLDILLHGCGDQYPHLGILKDVVKLEKQRQAAVLKKLSLSCPEPMYGLKILAESQPELLRGVGLLVESSKLKEPSPATASNTHSVVLIQAAARGYLSRLSIIRLRGMSCKAALSIQLAFRVMRARRRILEQRSRHKRELASRHEHAATEFAVIHLQAFIRGFLARKMLKFETHDTSLEPIVDPADVTPEEGALSPLDPSNCSRISTGSRRNSRSSASPRSSSGCPGIFLLASMTDAAGLQLLLKSASQKEEPVSEPRTPHQPSEGNRTSKRRFRLQKKNGRVALLPNETKKTRFHHASYLPKRALPNGKRPAFVLLTAMGAGMPGWDIEQSPDVTIDEIFVEKHGVNLDTVYDSINPYGPGQPNGPHAAEVYGNGVVAITKDELVEQRDTAVFYSHFKGQTLSMLLTAVTQRELAPWVECFKTVPIKDINSQVVKHRLSRMLNDQLAMAEGTETGMLKRLEYLYKKADAPSMVADSLIEQLNTDLAESTRMKEILAQALEALTQPIPEEIEHIMFSEDDYMLGLSLEEIANGSCVAQDAVFMTDEIGQLCTSDVIHTVFAPSMATDTSPNSLHNAYKLALTAMQQRGIQVCCLSPLLPRASTTSIQHPQHTVALHLMALAEVLTEQSWGMTSCYISSFDVPVEIARRAFEKRDVGFDLVVHGMDSLHVALKLDQPCALLVPSEPMNILCGRVGARWLDARGKAYRQEEEAVANSTAILAQANFNTVYFESIRHKLVDKKVPLLQRPLPPKKSAYKGRVVESKLPAGPGQRKQDLSILAKVKQVQNRDLVMQQELEERQEKPTVGRQKMLDKMRDDNEERQNFISRLERRIEHGAEARELTRNVIKDRDDRIRARKEKRLLELQIVEEQKRMQSEAEEVHRKERNRKHQELAAERMRRQKEMKEKQSREKEGQLILAEARENAERQKRVQAARELILNDREREERRLKMKHDRMSTKQDKREQEKKKQEDEARKREKQEETRRKLIDRAAEDRAKRQAEREAEAERIEQAKEKELRRKHVPKRVLPSVLPPVDRAAEMKEHAGKSKAAAAAGQLPRDEAQPQPERCSSAPDNNEGQFESPPADSRAQTQVMPRAPQRHSTQRSAKSTKPQKRDDGGAAKAR
eukprot:TRINITY_DN6422_c2_g1_i4.p1 TRINITY_DN6422_c2_g1~~TRINITY_DN6422_c2_g1_i4.p1  ORF type:complete len:1226 (+),score=282.66 TRINITY_DN6422_c2_g1_i4:77-3754(+)